MMNKVLALGALAAVLATPTFAESPQADKAKVEMQQHQSMPAKKQQHQSMPAAKGSKDKSAMDKSSGAAATTNGSAAKDNAGMDKDLGATKSAANATKRPGFVQSQSGGEWRASKLIGADVVGPDDKSIGEINELVLDRQGEIKAAVIGVGGFLGIGEKNVAVPFEALNVQRKPNSSAIEKITVTYTKKQLKSAPKFAYYEEHAKKATTTGMKPADTPPPGIAHPPVNRAPKK